MEAKSELQNPQAVQHRSNATEARIKWIDQQLDSSKGILKLLHRHKLRRAKQENIKYLNELHDKTPIGTVEATIKEAEDSLSK